MMRVKVQLNWAHKGMTINQIVHIGKWPAFVGPHVLVPAYWKFTHERDGQRLWVAEYMAGTRRQLIAEGVDEVVFTWSSAVQHPIPFDVDSIIESDNEED